MRLHSAQRYGWECLHACHVTNIMMISTNPVLHKFYTDKNLSIPENWEDLSK